MVPLPRRSSHLADPGPRRAQGRQGWHRLAFSPALLPADVAPTPLPADPLWKETALDTQAPPWRSPPALLTGFSSVSSVTAAAPPPSPDGQLQPPSAPLPPVFWQLMLFHVTLRITPGSTNTATPTLAIGILE